MSRAAPAVGVPLSVTGALAVGRGATGVESATVPRAAAASESTGERGGVSIAAATGCGAAVAGVADGLFARVLQHEVDHLDGILYPMRMTDLRHLAFTSELPHLSAWLERRGDPE